MTIPKQLIFFVSLMSIDSVSYTMDATPVPEPMPAEQKPFDGTALVKFLQENQNLLVGQENFDRQKEAERIEHQWRKNLALSLTNDLRKIGPDFDGKLPEFSKRLTESKDGLLFLNKIYNTPPQPRQKIEKSKFFGFKTFLMCAASTSIGAGVATAFFLLRR